MIFFYLALLIGLIAIGYGLNRMRQGAVYATPREAKAMTAAIVLMIVLCIVGEVVRP